MVFIILAVLAIALSFAACGEDDTPPAENGVDNSAGKDETPPAENEVVTYCDDTRGTVLGGGKYNEGDTVTLTATAAEGYVFDKWYNSDEVAVSEQAVFSFVVSADNDGTYYASFRELGNTYTVTLDVNGGNALESSVLQIEEGYDKPLPKPTRDGYYFCGWKTSHLIVSVKSTDRFREAYASVYADTTLYAVWLPERCATFVSDTFTISSIYTKEELFEYVGKSTCVLLEADIDLAGTEWTPLRFTGVFEGNKHTISNVYINYANYYTDNPEATSTVLCGFFSTFVGYADDVNISGVTIKTPVKEGSKQYPYMVCGGFAGEISNWYKKAIVGVYDDKGESVAYAITEVNDCSVSGFVIDGETGDACGALAGAAGGDQGYKVLINGCHTTGSIAVTLISNAIFPSFGGLIGNLNVGGIVRNSFSSVNITAEYLPYYETYYEGTSYYREDTAYVGGLIGSTFGSTVEYSYGTGTLSIKANCLTVGGVIGYVATYSPQSWINSTSRINNNYYKGDISYFVTSSATHKRYALIGGIAGSISRGGITNCWADAVFHGQTLSSYPDNVTSYAGGIVGSMYSRSYGDGTIKNCFTVHPSCIGNSENITVENIGTYGEFEPETVFGVYAFGAYVSADDLKTNPANVWVIKDGKLLFYWQKDK